MPNDYTGPAAAHLAAWDGIVPNSGQYVGVPDSYRVQQGYVNDPRMAAHYGTRQAYVGVYGVPTYTYAEVNSLYGKPKGQVWNYQYQLYALGYLHSFTPGRMGASTESAFLRAAEDANKNGMTFEQMLAQGKGGPGSPGSGARGPGGGGPRTVTQSSINLTSREGAQQILANALAQQLGRQPSDSELTRFTRSLNAHERANPTVTTTHYAAGGTASSSTTKQGNVDTGYEADQFGKKVAPAERNRFQDSQYMDIIASMIGAK